MCFNEEASIISWIGSVCISAFLINRNKRYDKWNAAFVLTFSTIQLLEYGIWRAIKTKNDFLNKTLTAMIYVALLVQPLVQTYFGATYIKVRSTFLFIFSCILAGLLLYGIFFAIRNSNKFFTTKGKKGHLSWKVKENDHNSPLFNNALISLLYLSGLFIPLLYMENKKGYLLLLVGIATAIFSFMYADKDEFGSFWCYTAIIYGFVAIFV